jgi:hypothetical protein
VLQKELWYVPSAKPGTVVSQVLLHTFKHPILGIVEAEPDVIMVSVCDLYHTHESQLARIDFKGWTPGKPVKPEIIFSFDDRARGLNGSCMLGPGVMALADCFAGLIWRVDLSDGARSATARVWLAHDTMAGSDAAVAPPPQPGVNGIALQREDRLRVLHSTAQKVFMRISVGKASLDPVGDPNSSPGSTIATTSASTRTADSHTSPGTAPTRSTGSRSSPGTAAKSGTSSTTRPTGSWSGRLVPHGGAVLATTAGSSTCLPMAAGPRGRRPTASSASPRCCAPNSTQSRRCRHEAQRARQAGETDDGLKSRVCRLGARARAVTKFICAAEHFLDQETDK